MQSKPYTLYKAVVFVISALLFIIYWFVIRDSIANDMEGVRARRACQEEEKASRQSINGIVLRKYLNQRRIRLFQVTEREDTIVSELLAFETSSVYDFLQEGDYLLKERGEIVLRVKRQHLDTLVVLDYSCRKTP